MASDLVVTVKCSDCPKLLKKLQSKLKSWGGRCKACSIKQTNLKINGSIMKHRAQRRG
jgi:hypothetical protein